MSQENLNPEEEIIEEQPGEETPGEEVTEDEEQAAYDKEYAEAMAKLDEEQPGEEEEEIEPGEETPGEEEQPEQDSLEPGEEQPGEQAPEEEPEMVTITWRGQEVQITKEQEKQLAQQGYDYTYKTQQLAESRKQHQAELELLEKVKKGDKEALAKLAHQAGVDPIDLLDIDLDNEQGTPAPGQNQPGEEEPFVSSQVAELLQEVQKDPELNEKMVQVQDYLPSNVIDAMAKDPETFYTVVNEVRSGDADIVLPQVNAQLASLPELDRSLVLSNPDQFANFYLSVKQSMISANQETQPKQQKRGNPNRSAAAINRSGNKRGQEENTTDPYYNDNEFERIKRRLENQ